MRRAFTTVKGNLWKNRLARSRACLRCVISRCINRLKMELRVSAQFNNAHFLSSTRRRFIHIARRRFPFPLPSFFFPPVTRFFPSFSRVAAKAGWLFFLCPARFVHPFGIPDRDQDALHHKILLCSGGRR